MNKREKQIELIKQIIWETKKKWSEELFNEIGLEKAETDDERIQMLEDYLNKHTIKKEIKKSKSEKEMNKTVDRAIKNEIKKRVRNKK